MKLKIALYNHKLGYRNRSRKLVQGSVQEKLWRETQFEPSTAAAATRSRQ